MPAAFREKPLEKLQFAKLCALENLQRHNDAIEYAQEVLNHGLDRGLEVDSSYLVGVRDWLLDLKYVAENDWIGGANHLSSCPPSPQFNYREALLRLRGGESEKCEQVIRTAFDRYSHSNDRTTLYWLCVLGERRPIPIEARGSWVDVTDRLRSSSTGLEERIIVAGVLANAGSAESALELLEECLEEVSNDSLQSAGWELSVYLRLAVAHLELGNHDEATRYFHLAEQTHAEVEFEPTDPGVWYRELAYELRHADLLTRLTSVN